MGCLVQHASLLCSEVVTNGEDEISVSFHFGCIFNIQSTVVSEQELSKV